MDALWMTNAESCPWASVPAVQSIVSIELLVESVDELDRTGSAFLFDQRSAFWTDLAMIPVEPGAD